MCCARLRNKIWKTFEEPNSSTAAKVKLRFIVSHQVSFNLVFAGVGGGQLLLLAGLHLHVDPLHGARVPGWSKH